MTPGASTHNISFNITIPLQSWNILSQFNKWSSEKLNNLAKVTLLVYSLPGNSAEFFLALRPTHSTVNKS